MKHLFPFIVPAIGFLVLPAMAAPVPKSETKLAAPTEDELRHSQNNIKQFLLAIHNFAAANNDRLPNNTYTKDGKGMLSWRVHILPFIEEDALYRQFKLDEPWDSEHNKKLISKMPKQYAPIRVKAKEGETFYCVFTGQGLFGPKAMYAIGNIPDGTSNTAFVVEASQPVIWTKPDDVVYDKKKKLPKLGGMFDGMFHIGLGDGSVVRIRKDPNPDILRDVIEPDDGNVTKLEEIVQK